MAGTMSTGRGRARTIAQINVTPLVDVVLVLLVILMVASTYIVAQTLKVQLPRAKSTDGTADKPTKVEILKDGHYRWNEEPVVESVGDDPYAPDVSEEDVVEPQRSRRDFATKVRRCKDDSDLTLNNGIFTANIVEPLGDERVGRVWFVFIGLFEVTLVGFDDIIEGHR